VKITKRSLKSPGTAEEALRNCGAVAARLLTRGRHWRNPENVGRSVMASSPLHPPVGCEQRRYLQKHLKTQAKFPVLFFQIWFSLLLLVQICCSLRKFFFRFLFFCFKWPVAWPRAAGLLALPGCCCRWRLFGRLALGSGCRNGRGEGGGSSPLVLFWPREGPSFGRFREKKREKNPKNRRGGHCVDDQEREIGWGGCRLCLVGGFKEENHRSQNGGAATVSEMGRRWGSCFSKGGVGWCVRRRKWGLPWFSLLLQKRGERWPGAEVGTAERAESGGSLVLSGFFGWGLGGNLERVKKSRGQGVAASPRDEEKIGFFRFRFSVLSLQNVSPHVIFFFVFHCSVAFIGEVWLGQNHNGPSTFPFLSFFFC